MISQLTVEHFQSIEKATLDLSAVNLVVGRNYSGKSALAIRALYALATNRSGDDFIQQGAKQARVSLVLDDGQEITWTKARGKGGEYTLGDRTFTKTAGQVPEEIAEALGIRPIVIDDTLSLMPQIQRQWDAPFLIGETGSRIARILGKLTKVDVIVSAQMSTRKKRDRHAKERDTAEEEHGRLTEQREALPPVEELRSDLTLVHGAMERAEKVEQNSEAVRPLGVELVQARLVVAVDLDPVTQQMSAARLLLGKVEQGREVKALQVRLTQARRVQAVDLGPVRQQIDGAEALLVGGTEGRRLEAALRLERKQLAGAEEGIESARAGVTAARERHAAECTRLGICDSCPFVEAV